MPTTDPKIVELSPQSIIEIRRTIPMAQLPSFYHEALPALGEFVGAHGITPTGPPMGVSHGMPGEQIDISAAMPVSSPVAGKGQINSAQLPGGRAASLTLNGAYEELAGAYEVLLTWISEQGERPGEIAWEQYMSMPDPDGDPAQNVTDLYWILA